MRDRSQIAAIVLAAGSSRRFGSDKLLHPVTRQGVTLPLAAHSMLPWLEAFEEITVVVRLGSGAFCREIAATLAMEDAARIRWLICNDAALGMGASLASGVRANAEAAGWLIGLADMPAIPADAIIRVRNALLGGAEVATPVCEGRRGHPVGFAAPYYNELQALRGDVGARGLLEREGSSVVPVDVSDRGILADIDTRADLEAL